MTRSEFRCFGFTADGGASFIRAAPVPEPGRVMLLAGWRRRSRSVRE